MTRMARRAWFGASAAFVGALAAPASTEARGRKPYGGSLSMKLPWPLDALDPHAIDDVLGALFGPALCDPLFALDPAGRAYTALAAELPERVAQGTRIVLRPNLLTARGLALDARDVLWSLARAARAGAAALLSPLGKPVPDPKEALAILVPHADPGVVAQALSSPLTAILPRGYARTRPDGTGAFQADFSKDGLVLKRNPNAARGASYLDRVIVRPASDLKDALRSFEAQETDLSWLGEFLHKPRPGAQKFDAGPFGYVLLRTGKDAGGWGAPGVAQKLLDALPVGRLAHLGIVNASGGAAGSAVWGGEAAEILVLEEATHLEQIGKELAAILSGPGHELRVAARPRSELEFRRERGRFALMLDFARPVGNLANAGALGVLTAAGATLAQKPALPVSASPRDVAGGQSLGVVGQLRATGAHVGQLREFGNFDLGGAWRK